MEYWDFNFFWKNKTKYRKWINHSSSWWYYSSWCNKRFYSWTR